MIALHSGLAFGGPTHSTDEKPIREISGSQPKAPCPAIEPRLSPYSTSLGRWSGGSFSHRSWIASIVSLPEAIDFSLSPRNEIQLGRKEYCDPTIAVSPLYIISSARAATGLIQPVPVVGTITHSLRSKAAAPSSSLSSTAIRLSSVSAVFRPTYTRIGSLAALPVSRVSSSASGPLATKLRPSNP